MKKIRESEKRKAHSLFNACLAGDLAGVRLILRTNIHTLNGEFTDKELSTVLDIDPKSWGRRPIHISTISGHFDIVKFLVENGADINSKNRFGDTALHFAIHHNRYRIFHFLIENGADPSIKNNVDLSPIDLAKEQNKLNFLSDLDRITN